MIKKIFLIFILVLTSCSSPNPNPGERTFDRAITYKGIDDKTFKMLKTNAEKGYPWAQLRMGVLYELGNYVKKDFDEAEKWYLLASEHYGKSGWSNGRIIFVYGKPGYFNQNGDALIAKFQLANIYLNKNIGKYDVDKAYKLIKEVHSKAGETGIFYCCQFDRNGGKWITKGMIKDTMEKAKKLKKIKEDKSLY